jgi:hypothetical protein
MHDIVLEVLISNFDVISNKLRLNAWKLLFSSLPMAKKENIGFGVAILFFVR